MAIYSEDAYGLILGVNHRHPEARAKAFRKLEFLHAGLEQAAGAAEDSALPAKVTAWSYGNTPVAHRLRQELADASFDESRIRGETKADLEHIGRALNTSLGCELGIKELRGWVDKHAGNKAMKAARQWHTLRNSGVLQEALKRDCMAVPTQYPGRKQKPISKKEFLPELHKGMGIDFDDIVNRKGTRKFFSPSQHNMLGSVSLGQLAGKVATGSISWSEAASSWHGCLLLESEIYVRVSDNKVFQIMASSSNLSAIVALPMKRVHFATSANGKERPPKDQSPRHGDMWSHDLNTNDLEWLACLSWDEYKALPTATSSPLNRRCKVTAKMVGKQTPKLKKQASGVAANLAAVKGACYEQTSDPVPVPAHAADQGFRGLLSDQVKKVAKSFGVPSTGLKVAELIQQLHQKIHGCTEEETIQKLQEAVEDSDDELTPFSDDVIAEVFEKKADYHDRSSDVPAEAKEIQKALSKHARKKAGVSTGSKKSDPYKAAVEGAPHSKVQACQKKALEYWKAPESDQVWTRDQVHAVCAPGTSASRGNQQGRWVATFNGKYLRNFSFGVHGGESNAVREMARETWLARERLTKQKCTYAACPVEGIFS